MKILIVVSTLDTGGAQRVAANLSLGLPKDCEVDFLLNSDSEIAYPYRGNVISLGAKPEKDKQKLSYQILIFIKRLAHLKKLKKYGDYDAVFSFLDSANFANILSGKKFCRTIVSIHSNLSSAESNWKYKYIVCPLIRCLYKHADNVVTVSKGIENDLRKSIKYKGNNVITIYNGFDLDRIRELGIQALSDSEKKLFDGEYTITTMGRLNEAKGYWHLIRAMSLVKECFPRVKLIILGEGEQRKYLSGLIKELKLEDNVILYGFTDNPFCLVKHSNLFVMSSLFEGLPSALIEAMALGIPCVSTDFKSGAREIIAPDMDINDNVLDTYYEEKYGVLSPVCDGVQYDAQSPLTKEEKLLADAIIHILSNEDIRKQYAVACQQAVERFTIDKMASNWMGLLQ
ncbi:glycosyltransferase [Butyrivibrio sp. INlla16]|uniref:glycosyltransferase n=1 Tax=Butyrivibrio sp. INlla16 TaxID=1520807 RepID=UPI000885D882|nr:glycosyltransferase [Butyrivibrio sp. INlla16]SDB63005.1 Glycosyltransferase involved in cell wall bisynthesis [Butyrivibrio sp. INlla16]